MKLNAKERTKDEKFDQKIMPAVVYGAGLETKSIKLNKVEFDKVYEEVGESNLIDLTIEDSDPVKVIVKDIQYHPVKGQIIHADLYQVDMTKKITTEIPLEYTGEAKAKKDEGALVMKNLDYVEVECLPSDLVDHIEIKLDSLEHIGDTIYIKDIKIPQGMEVLEEPETVVVSAIEPKVEEEPEPSEEVEEDVEGEKEEDKEETEGEKEEDKEEKKKED